MTNIRRKNIKEKHRYILHIYNIRFGFHSVADGFRLILSEHFVESGVLLKVYRILVTYNKYKYIHKKKI